MKIDGLINKIINADCYDILRQLPDKSIDLVLTDPPYGINADKGTNGFGISSNRRYSGGWDNKVPNVDVFIQIQRVAKNLLVWGGNYFADKLPISKCWIVWDKKGNMDFQNPFSDVELAWTNFTGVSKKYTCIQQGFVSDDKSERIHPTQKPLPLFQWCLQNYSKEGDLILDCFSGSGTTAVACHNLKRRFICIEKDPDYYEASVKRLEDAKRQLTFDF